MAGSAPSWTITYPADLPVSQRRDDIAAAIRDHQVVVVAGETGSGKTTQLPKICLELGRGRGPEKDEQGRTTGGIIGHTQPRRIAARSVAERLADELGTELGGPDAPVGYQVRFTDRTSRATRIKVMTDGILLAELQRDRDLRRYDTLIIDEAHERSLNIDFLLGYLKRLLPRRPDLKVVITSATIDVERFSQHFGAGPDTPAPVVEVTGRTFPVEVRYRPLLELPEDDEDGEPVQRDQTEAVVEACRELAGEGNGDVLVFLPGEREIRDTAEALEQALGLDRGSRNGRGGHVEVLPLFSRLSAAEQHRVFSSHAGRRIVLSTNVAETSLTVPGIRYVVDTGLARISRYSVRTKVQRLPIEPVSQASANQRAGRCGRVAPGICIRLYSEEDFEGRPEFTEPEILRTNLASVILQMTSLGLGDVARFPFVEPPDRRNVTAGVQLLEELGALQPGQDRRGGRRLTERGRRLSRLPIDPRLGRMLLEAEQLGCLREVLVITAALSLQDPRERPVEQRAQADQQHARFTVEGSDFLTWLALWRYLREQQHELSGSAFRRMCKREHLNWLRVREWQDYESQLRQVCKEMGFETGAGAPSSTTVSGTADTADADGIHQALLSGLLSQIGLLEPREKEREGAGGKRRPGPREYLGARGSRFVVFPGSALHRKNPTFLMAGELVETSRLFARQNAAIQPEWAERLGGDLVKRTYSEPHWSLKRGSVVAHERATLYGVPLVADRLVPYGKVDPDLSRELFIRHALVQGEWRSHHRFLRTNRALLDQAEELEHRARRRDIVVDEETLFDFYDARVGADVVSGAHFDGWWKKERRARPDLLTFDPSMLTRSTAEEVREADYPAQWQGSTEGLTFGISYHFEPGAAEDGLTIDLPVATLNQVDDADFSWNVPGLRRELVTALIRSLPKNLRVSLVPAPDKARSFLAEVPAGQEPLLDALERWVRSTVGVVVPRDAWDWDKVAPHLRPTFRVLGEDGAEQARGKDLTVLKAPLRAELDQALAGAADDSGLTRTGETTWAFGVVEDEVVQRRAGHEVRAFPALVDEGRSVGLTVLASAEEAEAHHRLGVRRLLRLEVDRRHPGAAGRVLDGLGNAQKLGLAGSPYPTVAALLDDALDGVLGEHADAAVGRTGVRDEDAFAALVREAGDPRAALAAVVADVLDLLDRWRAAEKALGGRAEMAELPALTDLQAQLAGLVHVTGPEGGFLAEAGPARLRRYRAYLGAVVARRELLAEPGGPSRDRQLAGGIVDVQDTWRHAVAALPPGRPPGARLRRARWMLEELRVSVWAQRLGTDGPISEQRVRKVLQA
ncbi:ATP-dependent RNA helicase HrpA [Nocardioides sp. AX2bis]|uniref:ATP-dependent RNA helicase HrpA n=1 Tax=Nocardioides sp. AX2bis TaxID=2653157 RepID=UPI001F1D4DD3|nr:ATP-dependent RNA helicase HrpA [Nocardioides sp. AX2bis]